MAELSLLSNPIRVMTPFIKVTIGDYNFGLFSQEQKIERTTDGVFKVFNFQYPNYIQSLSITKVNGQVNQYSLVLKYPITESSDPNFFEKVFSSVSKTRKIVFSYGDVSAPKYLYRNEEAIITDVKNQFDINSAVIQYTVTAVSSCKLATAGAFNFVGSEFAGNHKPSDIILKLITRNSTYGLLDLFPGMRSAQYSIDMGLIPINDKIVTLEGKENINVLDYIKYLVSCMRTQSEKSLFAMIVRDDTSDIFNGPYFQIKNTTEASDSLDTFVLDIGYPSENVVMSFSIDNNESYSILYDYSKVLNTNEYITRIADDGTTSTIYSPNITSNNSQQVTQSNDINWWKNVTEYPISATISIKGVLRPAILMSKLRLNVLFYGKAHISSGTYIINKQIDNVSTEGCWTTLNLVRVDGDRHNFKNIV